MIDDFKKRLKEIADKVSNSQSAQSITTTQTPKISTSISTNAKTTNKSGTAKNTAPIIKEPKREKVSWSDDASLDTWDDRSFLEGFYEVDSTVNDWEREKRMSQVEKSLKEIKKRKRKTQKPPLPKGSEAERNVGAAMNDSPVDYQNRDVTEPQRDGTAAWRWRDFESNSNAVRAPFRRDITGQRGTFTRLPGNPNAPAQITNLPNYGSRYPAYTNYVNAANKNTTTASTSGDTTRTPTKEEMQAAYADMQNEFSGQNVWKHMEDVVDFVVNAATPQNNTQGKTQTATTTSTAKTQSRDARVRENYRARQQAEADARYEDFDIEAAEKRLRDNDYWTDRLLESRRQGYGFAGDEQIAEERNALEEEIKRAKEAAERRRERYIREKVAQMPDNGLHELLRWSVRNMPETKQDPFSVSPQFANTLYPEISPRYSNGSIPQKNYYPKDKSIYGENTDKALDTISNILTATSLVPGVDTFADAAAIPVDLLRGDYISAGLDAFGILPFVGEVADTAKLARAGMNIADTAHDAGKVIDTVKTADKADDVSDTVKVTDDVYDYSKFPQKIHEGRQGKHIIGHNNYIPGRSITTVSNDRLLELMKTKVGTGTPYMGREVIDFGEVIGKYVDEITGEAYDTTIATVHYSQDGFHIIPAAPKEWRR